MYRDDDLSLWVLEESRPSAQQAPQKQKIDFGRPADGLDRLLADLDTGHTASCSSATPPAAKYPSASQIKNSSPAARNRPHLSPLGIPGFKEFDGGQEFPSGFAHSAKTPSYACASPRMEMPVLSFHLEPTVDDLLRDLLPGLQQNRKSRAQSRDYLDIHTRFGLRREDPTPDPHGDYRDPVFDNHYDVPAAIADYEQVHRPLHIEILEASIRLLRSQAERLLNPEASETSPLSPRNVSKVRSHYNRVRRELLEEAEMLEAQMAEDSKEFQFQPDARGSLKRSHAEPEN